MLANGDTKVCTRCRLEKPVAEFGRDGGREDGLTIYCRRCRRERYAVQLGEGKIVRDGVVVRPPPSMHTCERCGQEYRPRHRRQRFCSQPCASRNREPKPKAPRRYVSQRKADRAERPCETCGTLFRPFTARGRYCSRKCYGARTIGERKQDIDGYVRVRVPRGTIGTFQNGWMLEHRYVMQQSLGRPLTKHETVHHINGDKTDNRIENLQLRQGKHGKHAHYRCLDCGSYNVEPMGL